MAAPCHSEVCSGKKLRFLHFYYLLPALAAACFAMFFVYWQQNQPEHYKKKYIEVPLVAASNSSGVVAESENFPAPEALADKTQSPAAPLLEKQRSEAGANRDRLDAPRQNVVVVAKTRTGNSEYKDALPRTNPVSSRMEMAPLARAHKDPGANTEGYGFHADNDYFRVADQPLSTFAADVDTASYANIRRFIEQGQRPPVDAVRIEEMVNYFPYDYAGPQREESKSELSGAPFAAHLEVAAAPWAPEHRLVRIGLKGREVVRQRIAPAANLVFLLDVSGSMNEPNKLPLVKESMRLLVDKLRPDDRVAIVVYAGACGPGAAFDAGVAAKREILDALDRLRSPAARPTARWASSSPTISRRPISLRAASTA